MKARVLKLFYFLIIFSIVSLGLVLVVNYFVLPAYVDQGQERILLTVSGLSWDEASSLLRREGFVPIRGETQARPDMPPFTVLDQQPKAGQKVKLGRRVYLTVSTAEKNFPIPDLIGKTLRGAQLLINENNLVLDTVLYEYSSRPKDVVIQQQPERGSRVSRNTGVQLRVSLGISPFYTVPDVVFSSEQSAIAAIQDAGLEVGNIIYEFSDDFTPYTVMSQSIDPGVEVREKKKINLVVSKLPEQP